MESGGPGIQSVEVFKMNFGTMKHEARYQKNSKKTLPIPAEFICKKTNECKTDISFF